MPGITLGAEEKGTQDNMANLDDEDERDVFFGSVISKEEMYIIKKRGLRKNAQGDSEGGTAAVPLSSTKEKEANEELPEESMGVNTEKTASGNKLVITRSGRLVKPTTEPTKSSSSLLGINQNDLNKLTLANTKRNSGYHAVQIKYEDVFEPGPRPSSPIGKNQPEDVSMDIDHQISKGRANRVGKALCWNDCLTQQLQFDVQAPPTSILKHANAKNPFTKIALPAKPCLKPLDSVTPSTSQHNDSNELPTVNVKRIYYEDDELYSLLNNVPELLDQVLSHMSKSSNEAISNNRSQNQTTNRAKRKHAEPQQQRQSKANVSMQGKKSKPTIISNIPPTHSTLQNKASRIIGPPQRNRR
jgi:hypothetical protein